MGSGTAASLYTSTMGSALRCPTKRKTIEKIEN